ncbi:MAG TPA: cation-translocating P-type ATPase [Candidatus Pelethocola excrementipullorum]|nr:cation-translocating P-type ATPase [Candidatus Pelethocola excrementipullorum]
MRWYEKSKNEVIEQLESNLVTGLSSEQIKEKQIQYGKNEFSKGEKPSLIRTILHHLKDVSTIVLIIAAILSFLLALKHGEGFIEPLVISLIIVMNLILAITQEGKAEKALESLADLNSPSCFVIRDEIRQEIDTSELVPGDTILVEAGSLVPADARILESNNLMVDESSLTGESEPLEKDASVLPANKIPIAEQSNMLFSGCLVTAGNATAVVTETGMNTEMGKIAGFLGNTTKGKTPLQQRLDRVGKNISTVAVISAAVLFLIGMRQGSDFWSMIMLAVTLAVAAVPETLSLIVTLSLSHGVNNMVGKNALIRKLPAVETLGNTSVICSDKTGTLTQNRMAIKRLCLSEGEPVKDTSDFSEEQTVFLKMLASASNAVVQEDEEGNIQYIGDATETAIMRLLNEKGMDKAAVETEYPRVAEIPFSSERKMMTVLVEDPKGGYTVLTKGALDRIPFGQGSAEEIEHIRKLHDRFAEDALRVIALGMKHIDVLPGEDELETVEKDLTFVGIVGLIDPPRPEAAIAIQRAKKAGIRTIMITGDHAATAGAIAKELGILEDGQKVVTGAELEEMTDEKLSASIEDYSVYARVAPSDKIRIVEAWQKKGEVVAMTGDGVNDAPALKAADVGVAMGKAGTEVAKSSSDMILTDDNFATIVEAVHEGRKVYSNIRKTIYFLLVCNLSEIVVMMFAQIVGWGVLVTPVMLLLINVLGDGIPGLQLAKEDSAARIMESKPVKRTESLFSGGLLNAIIQQTIICSLVVLVAFYIGAYVPIGMGNPSAEVGQTLAFLVLGWTSILHIFTVRSRESMFKRSLMDNPMLVVSVVCMLLALVVLCTVPAIGGHLGLTALDAPHWLVAVGLSLIPTIVAEIRKLYDNHMEYKNYTKAEYSVR